jgi:hypothetical protein
VRSERCHSSSLGRVISTVANNIYYYIILLILLQYLPQFTSDG